MQKETKEVRKRLERTLRSNIRQQSIEAARRELAEHSTGRPIIASFIGPADDGFRYELLIYVRTIEDHAMRTTNSVRIGMVIPSDFPNQSPCVHLIECGLYHPNFTRSGEWVGNVLHEQESFEEYLLRLVRVLQYKNIDASSIGDRNAMAWYNKHNDGTVFPTDRINYRPRPRIKILSRDALGPKDYVK